MISPITNPINTYFRVITNWINIISYYISIKNPINYFLVLINNPINTNDLTQWSISTDKSSLD